MMDWESCNMERIYYSDVEDAVLGEQHCWQLKFSSLEPGFVEFLKWISPKWIHANSRTNFPQSHKVRTGVHWSQSSCPWAPSPCYPVFKGEFYPWVPPLIDVGILYLCCFIYAYGSLLHFSGEYIQILESPFSTQALYFHLYHNQPPVTCFI